MAKSFSLDEAMERLEHYHNKMEKQQPGYLKSKYKSILDRDFLEFMRKKSGKDVDKWLLDNALKSGAKHANKSVNRTRGERFMREVQLGGKNILLAPFRLAFQILRLFGAVTVRVVGLLDPRNVAAFARYVTDPGDYVGKIHVGDIREISQNNQQPNVAQSQQQTPDGKLSNTVVQPNGQLQTANYQQPSVVPQPAAVPSPSTAPIQLPASKTNKPETHKKGEQLKVNNKRPNTRRKLPPAGQRKGRSR